MIDICDFAVGLSRQLYGLTIQSERPDHSMIEAWRPARRRRRHLGVQFPGRGVVVERGAGAGLRRFGGVEAVGEDAADARWRSQALFRRAAAKFGADAPDGLLELLIGGARRSARRWSTTRAFRVVSATGSTRMGRVVGAAAGAPLRPRASSNSAATTPSIVTPVGRSRPGAARRRLRRDGHRRPALHHAAPPDSSMRASTTRLMAAAAPRSTRHLGRRSARAPSTLVGPLIDGGAFTAMQTALAEARGRGRRSSTAASASRSTVPEAYLRPPGAGRDAGAGRPGAARRPSRRSSTCCNYRDFDEALALHNGVPQGLSSSIFATDIREVERFLVRGRLRLRHRQRQHRAPRAPRSAALSAARRRPAAAARAAPTPGRPTCAARPAR